jgi:hypothetical protein
MNPMIPSDGCERLNAVVQEMKRIAALDAALNKCCTQNYMKLHSAINNVFSMDLFDQVIEEYRNQPRSSHGQYATTLHWSTSLH